LSAFMFHSKGTLIIRRRGRFYKVLRTRHLGDNWWTFECKDLDTKKDASFDYQVYGMWEMLRKSPKRVEVIYMFCNVRYSKWSWE
jgi:hypothetical protein